MNYYVNVGKTVVAAFDDPYMAMRCTVCIAIGCKPRIKKSYHTQAPQQGRQHAVAQKHPKGTKRDRIEAQQSTLAVSHARIRYLKPGEFKL